MEVRGTTTVSPWPNGLGWLTCGVSVVRMVRLPWAMATVETRTAEPMTMVPEASSMMTRAIWSGSTRSCSISARKPTVSRPASASATVRGSVAVATAAAARVLMAVAMRRAVVRFGLRSDRRMLVRPASA